MEAISHVDKSITDTIERELKKSKSKRLSIKEISNDIKPAFLLVGSGLMRKENMKDLYMKTIDMIDQAMNMDADEKFCFSTIKDKVQYSVYDKKYINQVKITGRMLKENKYRFSRGFNKLKAKDLVRRVKRSTYMINPLGIIPNVDFDEEYKIYYGEHPRESIK